MKPETGAANVGWQAGRGAGVAVAAAAFCVAVVLEVAASHPFGMPCSMLYAAYARFHAAFAWTFAEVAALDLSPHTPKAALKWNAAHADSRPHMAPQSSAACTPFSCCKPCPAMKPGTGAENVRGQGAPASVDVAPDVDAAGAATGVAGTSVVDGVCTGACGTTDDVPAGRQAGCSPRTLLCTRNCLCLGDPAISVSAVPATAFCAQNPRIDAPKSHH